MGHSISRSTVMRFGSALLLMEFIKIFRLPLDWGATNGSGIANLTAVGGSLFFIADGKTLYKSDGTLAGTISLLSEDNVANLVPVADKLYFSAKKDSSSSFTLRSHTWERWMYCRLQLPQRRHSKVPCIPPPTRMKYMGMMGNGRPYWKWRCR